MIDARELDTATEGGEDPAALDTPSEPEPQAPPASPNGHLPRLSIEDIVAAQDLAEDTIDVPEWGGSLLVRAMTKQRQLEIRNEAAEQGDRNLAELLMFTTCVIDPEMTSEHVAVLRGKSAAVFDRVMRRILELNGADAGAVERAKARFPAGADASV